jgi:hypothetical protein
MRWGWSVAKKSSYFVQPPIGLVADPADGAQYIVPHHEETIDLTTDWHDGFPNAELRATFAVRNETGRPLVLKVDDVDSARPVLRIQRADDADDDVPEPLHGLVTFGPLDVEYRGPCGSAVFFDEDEGEDGEWGLYDTGGAGVDEVRSEVAAILWCVTGRKV